MDILVDGGIFLDRCGYPKEIYGIDEACQRVRLTLSTLKGQFIYNRSFGADFSEIISGDLTQEEKSFLGEFLSREALIAQKEITVSDVSFIRQPRKLLIRVKVRYNDIEKYTEVQIA